MDFKAFVRRHAVGSYFALALLISWTGSVLGLGPSFLSGEVIEPSALLLPGLLMISGPSVSGLLLIYAAEGPAGLRNLLARMTRWRVGGRWYAVLLIFPALILATLLPLAALVSTELTPTFFVIGIALGFVAGFFEEIGWTGFALPQMRRTRGILGASIVLGFVHALWHLPADYLGNSNAFGAEWLPYFASFFVFVIALRILIAWVYSNTESVLLAQLMHASSSGFLAVLVPIGIGGLNWSTFYATYAVVLWGAVAIVLARYGDEWTRPAPLSP